MSTKRTPAQIGAAVRTRRKRLKLSQNSLPGVSAATVRKLELGTHSSFDDSTLIAVAEALMWPYDFYDRLRRGDEPDAVTAAGAVTASARSKTLDRFRRLAENDPISRAGLVVRAPDGREFDGADAVPALLQLIMDADDTLSVQAAGDIAVRLFRSIGSRDQRDPVEQRVESLERQVEALQRLVLDRVARGGSAPGDSTGTVESPDP